MNGKIIEINNGPFNDRDGPVNSNRNWKLDISSFRNTTIDIYTNLYGQ